MWVTDSLHLKLQRFIRPMKPTSIWFGSARNHPAFLSSPSSQIPLALFMPITSQWLNVNTLAPSRVSPHQIRTREDAGNGSFLEKEHSWVRARWGKVMRWLYEVSLDLFPVRTCSCHGAALACYQQQSLKSLLMPRIAPKSSSRCSSRVHSGNREDDRMATAVKRWDLGAEQMYQMMENIFPCLCHSWNWTEILGLGCCPHKWGYIDNIRSQR